MDINQHSFEQSWVIEEIKKFLDSNENENMIYEDL
jgi:hypothetical protein